MAFLPIAPFLRSFHTRSSGFSSGEYGGRKKSRKRFLFDKTGYFACLMRWMSINNQEYLSIGAMKQSFNELDKAGSPDAASDHHESEFALGAHRRDHVQSKTSTGTAHNWSLSLNSPCRTSVMVRPYSSLVSKEYQGFFFPSKAANLRKFLDQPFLHFFWFLLISPPDWTLRRQSELRQQPANRCFAQFHTKSIVNYLADHFGRPQRIGKLHLKRIFHRNSTKNPLQSVSIQFWRPTAPFAGIQGTPAAISVSRQPTIHGCTGDTHCFRYNLRAMAFMNAGDGSLSYSSKCLMIQFSRICFSHAQNYSICG
jgi:hypothetical protein